MQRRTALLTLLCLVLVWQLPAARAQGLLLEDAESYRSFTPVPQFRGYLPVAVDLSARLPPPGDQGAQSSCVGWAVGYAARTYYDVGQTDGPYKASTLVSPSYLYNQIREGDCSAGSRISDALTLLHLEGAAVLADFPYSDRSCARLPDAAQRSAAARLKIPGWKRLDVTLDQLRGALAMGNPVVLAIEMTPSLSSFRGKLAKQPLHIAASEAGAGYHAILAIGYDDARQAFLLQNSWGPDWGSGGRGWVDYASIVGRARQAFIIDAPTKPPPGPPAPPPPAFKVEAALAKLLASFDCAAVQVAPRDDGALVTGFVGGEVELERLREAVANLPNREQVTLQVALRPWPQCEALLTLQQPLAASAGMELRLRGVDGEASLKAGDDVTIEVTAPDFRSFLYVVYLQADGSAVYLAQPASVLSPTTGPGQGTVFGGGTSPWGRFTVSPPYGSEMVLALAAASPLFDTPRDNITLDRAFLSDLRLALLREENRGKLRLAAVMLAITTGPD